MLSADNIPTETITDYIETSIRLETCFAELRHLDKHGSFLGKHPFITQRTERERLQELLASDPLKFIDELHNIEGNISRYRSHLKSPKYTGDKLERETENLRRFEALKKTYQEILVNRLKS